MDGTGANLPHSNSLTAKVAALFAARPNDWIDGRDVALVGGAYGWRTRIADARRPPFNLDIQNRQRRLRHDGRSFVVSEYRYVPREDPRRENAGAAHSSAPTLF